MALFSKGLVAAMEDEMAETIAMEPEGTDNMAADLVEVTDISGDVEQGVQEAEQASDDAQQLTRHIEVLTDAEGDGGAAPETVEATEIAVEAIYNRLGIRRGKGTGFPALESFTTKQGRARSTRQLIVALEEETKGIWAAIKRFFERLKEMVAKFISKVGAFLAKAMQSIKNVGLKLKSISSNLASKKIDGNGIYQKLGCQNGSDFKLNISSNKVFENFNVVNRAANELVGFKPENLESFSVKPLSLNKSSNVKNQAPEGMQWYTAYDDKIANISVCWPASNATGEQALSLLSNVDVVENSNNLEESKEISILTQKDIENINAFIPILEGLKKTGEEQQGINSKAESSILNNFKINENVKTNSTLNAAITKNFTAPVKLASMLASQATRIVPALNLWVSKSLEAAKEGEKPAEGAAPAAGATA